MEVRHLCFASSSELDIEMIVMSEQDPQKTTRHLSPLTGGHSSTSEGEWPSLPIIRPLIKPLNLISNSQRRQGTILKSVTRKRATKHH